MKLSPLTVVAFIAASVTAQGDKKEWTGTLSTIDGGLKGDVSVVNSTMIMITSYSVEASAPALYWWGSKVEDLPKEGFRVNNERVSMNADDETIMIPLDNDKTTADFDYFGLYCEKLAANFGQTKLEMPDGDSGSSSSSDSNEVNDNAAKGRNLPFASAVGAILAASAFFLHML